MVKTFSCGICSKLFANSHNHQSIKSDKCNLWTHIKCNKTKCKNQIYIYLQTGTFYWYCMSCNKEFLPFSDTSDEKFMQTAIGKQIKFAHIGNIPKSVMENFIRKIT